jgi:DNA-binding ferritin-like protein
MKTNEMKNRASEGTFIRPATDATAPVKAEEPLAYPSASQMTAELPAGHEAVIQRLRADVVACGEKLGDAGTADFLTGLMEQHEKMAWMLRAVLAEKN